jgi:putative ABC transport system permease protein
MRVETLWQDIKYGLRMLRRSPGFAVLVVLILAIGISANTAVFSVVNAVMLKPLPYKDADRLVIPWEKNKEGLDFGMSVQDLVFLREQNQAFEYVAGHRGGRFYVTGIDRPHEARAAKVSSCLFDLLGVRPLLGRGFRPEEEQPGNHHVIVLSHAFWKDHLGGAPDAVGKIITFATQDMDSKGRISLNRVGYTVIGVMSPDFEFPFTRSAPFWVPLVPQRASVSLLARLREGVTLERASAEMAAVTDGLRQLNPAGRDETTVGVDRLLDRALKGNRTILLLLLGAAGFVLLITCSAAANLFLARAAGRRREMATRMALGASRWRLVRQTLTESLVVSLGAGLLGLFVTFCTVKGLVGLCPADIPRLSETRIDLSVLVFTLGASVLTGLAFGVMPAWRTADVRAGQTLKEGLTLSRSGLGWRCLRGSLVVAQIGVSLILLIGATLLVRSLMALHDVDLGFRPQNVLAMHVDLPRMKYPKTQDCQAFFQPLLRQVQALPDVRTAALVCPELDWGGGGAFVDLLIDGRPPKSGEQLYVKWMAVTPGFFKAMGMEVLQGRTFTEQDLQRGRSGGVIIDENLARKYFPDVDPIGQRVNAAPVIGVVRTVRDFQVLTPLHDTLYMPLHAGVHYQNMDLLVRTDGDPMRLAPALKVQVAALDKDPTIVSLETLEGTLAKMLAPRRFTMILLGLFAGIALILAAAGIYGLLQYSTTQQTHDIGIRMALGARGIDVLKVVLRQGLKLALIGVATGVAGAVALTRVLSSLLYHVTPTDPVTLILVSCVLIGVALLASYLPARRAARIDPMVALRYE